MARNLTVLTVSPKIHAEFHSFPFAMPFVSLPMVFVAQMNPMKTEVVHHPRTNQQSIVNRYLAICRRVVFRRSLLQEDLVNLNSERLMLIDI